MNVITEEMHVGPLRIELSVYQKDGATMVVCTARDRSNKKVWSTPILHEGKIRVYQTHQEALADARMKISGKIKA